ncbi:hypothetical protein A6C57_26865 (plasmid) [Fibrella sp. ES10-3-2-2]
MSDITTYIVGEPLPFPAPPGIAPDSPVIQTNTDFLDIILYSSQAMTDRLMWQRETAHLAIFHRDALPYILVHFPLSRMTFDCPYNIWRVDAAIRQAWFLSEKTMMNLILAQHGTNEFYGIQRHSIPWANQLRQVCEQQTRQYKSAAEVDALGYRLEAQLGVAQMWQQRVSVS